MQFTNEDECRRAGLDPKQVERIARKLSAAAKEAQSIGLTIFSGIAGTASLRFHDDPSKGALIIADLDGRFDGGDGSYGEDVEGLLRGEA